MSRYHSYSEEDLKYIRQHYFNTSVTEMAKHCGVSFHGMQAQIERMGLKTDRSGCPYNDGEVYLLRQLAEKNKTVEEIADALGRTERSVENKVRELNIKVKGRQGQWTVEDMEYIRRNWGKVPLSTIMTTLKRTESAVTTQARKMKLKPCYLTSENIPLSEFCRDTGITRGRIVKTLVIKFDFPLKSMKPGPKKIFQYVDIELILPWLESHQSLYDASKIPQYYFGVEPDWLVKKRRADANADTSTMDNRFSMTRWSKEESSRLKSMVAAGYDYSYIAKELGRTEKACRGRLDRMGLSYTSPRFWRGKEFKVLNTSFQDKTDDELAAEIGRSKSSVIHHRTDLGLSRKKLMEQKLLEDEAYIKEHWQQKSDKDLAAVLGRSDSNIRDIRLRLGLLRTAPHKSEG